MTAATIYIALVLTAMQVGLATSYLGSNVSFQNASWGFTIFAILGPLIGVLVAGIVGIFQFCINLVKTRRLTKPQLALFEKQQMQNHVP